jgi:hypothetical protein
MHHQNNHKRKLKEQNSSSQQLLGTELIENNRAPNSANLQHATTYITKFAVHENSS